MVFYDNHYKSILSYYYLYFTRTFRLCYWKADIFYNEERDRFLYYALYDMIQFINTYQVPGR